MAFFFGVYLDDAKVESLLCALRKRLEGAPQTLPHITFAGPYKHPDRPTRFIKHDRLPKERLQITGVGNFFDEEGYQNTVYIELKRDDDISHFWWKKNYQQGPLHLTIYNGSNRDIAKVLFETAQQYIPSESFINIQNNITRITKHKSIFQRYCEIDVKEPPLDANDGNSIRIFCEKIFSEMRRALQTNATPMAPRKPSTQACFTPSLSFSDSETQESRNYTG